ncbi:MAG: Endo,4-beta-xylanase precursor [Gemmataceae bacterium]|nr:Endo,4-beta-xylanase precursor [Gemmataceae bacterium]
MLRVVLTMLTAVVAIGASANPARALDYREEVGGWWLILDHDEVNAIAAASSAAKAIPQPLLRVAVIASVATIKAADALGGEKGVILYSLDTVGVNPVSWKPFAIRPYSNESLKAVREEVQRTGRQQKDLMRRALDKPLDDELVDVVAGKQKVRDIVNNNTASELYYKYWMMAVPRESRGFLRDIVRPGRLSATAREAEESTYFDLFLHSDGSASLRYRTGYLCAELDDHYTTIANRPEPLTWEKWTVERQGDGTVSFKSHRGKYLCAEGGGGKVVWANRDLVGEWEKFKLVYREGKYCLVVHLGQYVKALD